MQKNLVVKSTKLALVGASLALAPLINAADLYEVIDLGPVDSTYSESYSINDLNTVVGTANGEDFLNRAFIYQDDLSEFLSYIHSYEVGEVTYEGHSIAYDINNLGVIVGSSKQNEVYIVIEKDDDGNDVEVEKVLAVDTAVVFDQENQTLYSIPKLENDFPRNSNALGINDNNLVIGWLGIDQPDEIELDKFLSRGFFYDIPTETLTVVEPLSNEENHDIVLRDINNTGLAVGISENTIDDTQVIQVVSVSIDNPDVVEALEGFEGNQQFSWAINDANKVVGREVLEDGRTSRAFVYDLESGEITNLGFLNENLQFSEAYDINNSDQIVGVSQYKGLPARIFHAFLYENGSMRNLNDLIACDSPWTLNEARSINDYDSGFNSGAITGTGLLNGEKRAFMLMPVAGSTPDCNPVEDEPKKGGASLSGYGLIALFTLLFIARRRG